MMSLKDIKELNNKFKKNKEIAYKYDGTELRTLNGEHIGLDLMLSDEGLELQICKVNEINYTKNGKEKIWETFAFEEINIDKFETDEELDKYLEYVVNFYENRVKNDIDEEGFVINRDLVKEINYMEYKGILVQYIYDTNTLIFSLANKEILNDSDDLDCIVYRNYTKEEVEKHIDILVKNLIEENKIEKVYHLKNTFNDHDEYTTDENKIIMIYIDEMTQCAENNICRNNFEEEEYRNAMGWLNQIMLLCGKFNRNEIDINKIIEKLNKEHNWAIEIEIKKESENMFNEKELEQMVIDLKLGETSENFKEMLEKINENNKFYKELLKVYESIPTLKEEHKDFDEEMLFLEYRGWFCVRMEQEILSYVKGVF